MKQTFLPIAILLSVTLTLVAFLYFTDTSNRCCEEASPAKRIRTGIITSSLELAEASAPTSRYAFIFAKNYCALKSTTS